MRDLDVCLKIFLKLKLNIKIKNFLKIKNIKHSLISFRLFFKYTTLSVSSVLLRSQRYYFKSPSTIKLLKTRLRFALLHVPSWRYKKKRGKFTVMLSRWWKLELATSSKLNTELPLLSVYFVLGLVLTGPEQNFKFFCCCCCKTRFRKIENDNQNKSLSTNCFKITEWNGISFYLKRIYLNGDKKCGEVFLPFISTTVPWSSMLCGTAKAELLSSVVRSWSVRRR